MSSTVILREIKPNDMEAIFDVRVKTWHHPYGEEEMLKMGITHESVCHMLEQSYRGWLAECDDQVIGFAIGNKVTGEMWVIAVLKEFENQGIGKLLMQRVEKWLISEGCAELWLTTDTNEDFRAVGFYRHLGWEDWKFEDGDRFMKKRIE
ncbi:MAG: GNAT family N-acetyltransferase [Aeoliella sp.]